MGLDWSKLKETLNPKFDWDTTAQEVLKTADSLEDVCFPFCIKKNQKANTKAVS